MTTPTNKQLREFIIATFNESELETFCFDHFDEVRLPVGIELSDKAIRLIRYCKNRDLLADLLAALQEERPRQYGRRFGVEIQTSVPVPHANVPAPKPAPPMATKPAAKPNANSFIHEKTGMEFVRVPAGMFKYGDEGKPRPLAEFWISKTPVTQSVYKRFIDANPSHRVPSYNADWAKAYNWDEQRRMYPHDKAEHPVVMVSWHDAIAFCKWAGLQLPTEEQWEKAARGPDGRTHPWGEDEPTDMLCNFDKNIGKTTLVGGYSPQGDSPYGCADMIGNVLEWCLNKHKTLEDTSIDDSDASRVVRGGSWYDERLYVRAANHDGRDPSSCYSMIGFRVVAVRPPFH